MPTALLIRATLAVYVVLAIPRFGQRAPISHGREFQLTHPCPWTGLTSGACPGYVKDHIVPLVCGGRDAVSNMQWQTIREARAQDKWETKGCGRQG